MIRPRHLIAGTLAALSVSFPPALASQAVVESEVRPLASDCSGGYVTFTFDDGPDNTATPLVLEQLRLLKINAVFFVLGQKVSTPEGQNLVRQEDASGNLVENHTWDHTSFTGASTSAAPLSADEIVSELNSASTAIVKAGLPAPTLYRPPYGDTSAWSDLVAQHAGYRIVMPWGSPSSNIVDSQDWTGISTDQIVSNVVNGYRASNGFYYSGIHAGSIIALHDGISSVGATTALALQGIVDAMNSRSLCATTQVRADATGGMVPAPPPPPPSAGNVLQNSSLEQLKNNNEPACFQQGGSTTGNFASWSLDAQAATGATAERVNVSSWTSGDRKFVITQRASEASCLAKVTPGTRYGLWLKYRGDWPFIGNATKVCIVSYYRDSSGVWRYWESGPLLAPTTDWTPAYLGSSPLPAGATAISFGMSITGIGSFVTDDYSLAALPAQ